MLHFGEVDGFDFEAKVYDNPSQFGLDPSNPRKMGMSRISKLWIYDEERAIYSYERGFDGGTKKGVEVARRVAALFS